MTSSFLVSIITLVVFLGIPLALQGSPEVVINEIYYDPPDKSIPSEFIELYNAGDQMADLSGFHFSDGISFFFAQGLSLRPGEYLIVAQDVNAFRSVFDRSGNFIAYRVPAGTNGGQNYSGALGMDFVVESPVIISELGVFDSGSDGLNRDIVAQLWSRDDRGTPSPADDTGVEILATLTFTPGDDSTLIGGSRFKALSSPLTLPPGAYTMVASGYGSGELLYNGGSGGAGTADAGGGLISYVGTSRFGSAGTFPNRTDQHVHQYAAGTFRFSPPDGGGGDPVATVLGPWTGKLRNSGEKVVLLDSTGVEIDEVTYDVGFPWPISAQGEGASMELLHPALDNNLGGSWRSSTGLPTPGMENSVLEENPPPQLRHVNHDPIRPMSADDVIISVKVTDPDGVAGVNLEYQFVDPGDYIRISDDAYETEWTTMPMTAEEGTDYYAALMPGALQMHRRLVRYRFRAIDALGAETMAPHGDDPQPNFAYFIHDGVPEWTGSFEPFGTDITYGPDAMASLPAFHLISRESDILSCQYNSGYNDKVFRFLGTLVVGDRVYDHMRYRIRGQYSTYVSGKNKWKLKFNRGHELRIRDRFGKSWPERLRTLNFGTCASPWAPPNRGLAGMDEALAFKFFNLAGVPAPHIAPFQLRVIDDTVEASSNDQYDGDLWGLYLAFENPSGDFLDSHDLPEGNLFRLATSASELEHQGPGLPGDLSDLRYFTSSSTGYNRSSQPVSWWRENVNLQRYYSYRSVVEAVNHSDLREQQNSLMYFNPESGLWSLLPWDLDLLYEEFDRWGPHGTQSNAQLEQFRKCLAHAQLDIEFGNRVRELQDLLLNTDEGWRVIEEYAGYVEDFADVDCAMWNYHPRAGGWHKGAFYQEVAPYPSNSGGAGQTRRRISPVGFRGMVNWVKAFIPPTGFGGGRLAAMTEDDRIPEKPTVTAMGHPGFPVDDLVFRTSAFIDPQGSGTFAALMWRIAEVRGLDPEVPDQRPIYEITPVWTSGEILEFSPDIIIPLSVVGTGRRYRVRVRMKDTTERWSHWSNPVEFTTTPPQTPIPALEDLRISEIMYHPESSAEFEFIEFENRGDETLDLRNVHFLEGIDFSFNGSAVESLGPGEVVVIVRNLDLFATRYDLPSIRVAGEFSGSRLNNTGERLVLGYGQMPILDFAWDAAWYPETNGLGASLNIADIDLPAAAWNLQTSWFPSVQRHGTPGHVDPNRNGAGGGGVVPGDVNLDGSVDLSDAISFLVLLFQGDKPLPCEVDDLGQGGNLTLLDANGDGKLDLADVIHQLNYLFNNGDPHHLGTDCVPIEGCADTCLSGGG